MWGTVGHERDMHGTWRACGWANERAHACTQTRQSAYMHALARSCDSGVGRRARTLVRRRDWQGGTNGRPQGVRVGRLASLTLWADVDVVVCQMSRWAHSRQTNRWA